jgi:hypothetical protein
MRSITAMAGAFGKACAAGASAATASASSFKRMATLPMSTRLLSLASHAPNQISFAVRKGKFEESAFAAAFQRFPAAKQVKQ